uniref:AAA domain-containing protein n=1 Tax=Rhabditophanes sp. KR3021 TaxID=114890 RepID=A0AC35TZX2_9BILA
MAVSLGISVLMFKMALAHMMPELEDSKKNKKRAEELLKEMGLTKIPPLNDHERAIIQNFVKPEEGESYENVIGYGDVISLLKRRVLYPMMIDFKNTNKLLHPPKGVLLYGPPGCGKTKIARTIAGESGFNFINVDMSVIMDKYFGESQKMVSAIFSLAKKLQPCVLFIDEVESFLRTRSSSDFEATASMKAVFMSQWDGFMDDNTKVVIIAATNLPNFIDPAILRRMPVKIEIGLPGPKTRLEMFEKYLPGINLNSQSGEVLAQRSKNLTCADIVEVCRFAIGEKVGEILENIDDLGTDFRDNLENIKNGNHAETISYNDLLTCLNAFVREKVTSMSPPNFNISNTHNTCESPLQDEIELD